MKNKQFTKDDLKVGYVVKLRNGAFELVITSYVLGKVGPKIISVSSNGSWSDIQEDFNDDLYRISGGRNSPFDIVEVYGYSKFATTAALASDRNRDLLWKREEKTCDSCAHKVVCTHVGMCEHYMEKN